MYRVAIRPPLRGSPLSVPVRRAASPFERNAFLQALVRQVRKDDLFGFYQHDSDIALLQSFLGFPAGEEMATHSRLRISAFYGAIAAEIERLTGRETQLFLNLNATDLGSVLIFCDRLLVCSEVLRQVRSFKFDAIERLSERGESLMESAMLRACQYLEF